MCTEITRYHHHTGRILIQPVHDARTRQLLQARIAGKQAVHQRSVPMTRRWMDHQASRFIDHENIRILMQDIEFDILRLIRDDCLFGNIQLHLVTAVNLLPGFADLLIELDESLLNPLLDAAARIFGQQLLQRMVQAVAGVRLFNVETLLN